MSNTITPTDFYPTLNSNTITPTVFYRTLNLEGLEIFYREASQKTSSGIVECVAVRYRWFVFGSVLGSTARRHSSVHRARLLLRTGREAPRWVRVVRLGRSARAPRVLTDEHG